MLITSRSSAEYRAMFDLTDADLAGAWLLDCCAGGSSFVADAEAMGAAGAIAVDPAYLLPRSALVGQVREGLVDGGRMIDAHADSFDWTWYGEPGRRARLRVAAADRFAADIAARPDRYLAAALPQLPLAEGSVDVALCSHLLFTWANQFDADWHRAALAELLRVARREVRVFPLVLQQTGAPVSFLDDLRADFARLGHPSQVRAVPYRFQVGGDRMLVLRR